MKVLVIAYYFPPQTSVGTFRTARLLDYFAKQGIQAEVLTVRNPSRRFHPYPGDMQAKDVYQGHLVTRTRPWPSEWLWTWAAILGKRLGSWFGRKWSDSDIAPRFWFVDIEYGWLPSALRAGKARIKRFKPDVIYVSCPPFSSTVVAHKLARYSGKPYVLDFRDSWINSHYTGIYQSRRYGALEKQILNDANALIVTTPSDQRAYTTYFAEQLQRPADDISLVYNAYEPSFVREPQAPHTDCLTVLYTGAWDTQARSPRKLLECLAQLPFAWRLVSVGPNNQILSQAAVGLDLSRGQVECRDPVPKAALIPMMDEADVLFLIQGETSPGHRNTHIAAKTFDYLATGIPVLALMADGDNREFLAEYQDGIYLAHTQDAASITATLERLQADWKHGRLSHISRKRFLENFSEAGLSQQVVGILEQAVSRGAIFKST